MSFTKKSNNGSHKMKKYFGNRLFILFDKKRTPHEQKITERKYNEIFGSLNRDNM